MSRILGVVTIGQSPRDDVVPELRPLLPGVTLREAGALDGETPAALATLAAEPAGPILVTRLRDGREIRIGEHDVLPRVERAIAAVEGGAEAVLLLCTGPFPTLAARVPLLYPDRILGHFVAGVVAHTVVGVLTPAAAQIPWQATRWRATLPDRHEIVIATASPYASEWRAAFRTPLEELAGRRPGLVVMDCLGYDRAMRDAVRARLGVPTILARTVLARAAAELLGLDAAGSPRPGR